MCTRRVNNAQVRMHSISRARRVSSAVSASNIHAPCASASDVAVRVADVHVLPNYFPRPPPPLPNIDRVNEAEAASHILPHLHWLHTSSISSQAAPTHEAPLPPVPSLLNQSRPSSFARSVALMMRLQQLQQPRLLHPLSEGSGSKQ